MPPRAPAPPHYKLAYDGDQTLDCVYGKKKSTEKQNLCGKILRYVSENYFQKNDVRNLGSHRMFEIFVNMKNRNRLSRMTIEPTLWTYITKLLS